MNHYIFFDLVGTLLSPSPAVHEVYHFYGTQHGSSLDKETIKNRFKTAFNKYFSNKHQFNSNEEIEKRLWQSLVKDVFSSEPVEVDNLFSVLWDHFSKPDSWQTIDTTTSVLPYLLDKQYYIGIASNFDSRIIHICHHHFPSIDSRHIYYSTQLGFAKPDPEFYAQIQYQVGDDNGKYYMIGDDDNNDIIAASNSGWIPIHINQIDRISELL